MRRLPECCSADLPGVPIVGRFSGFEAPVIDGERLAFAAFSEGVSAVVATGRPATVQAVDRSTPAGPFPVSVVADTASLVSPGPGPFFSRLAGFGRGQAINGGVVAFHGFDEFQRPVVYIGTAPATLRLVADGAGSSRARDAGPPRPGAGRVRCHGPAWPVVNVTSMEHSDQSG